MKSSKHKKLGLGFFEDYQKQRYPFNDKIRWIFKQLFLISNNIEGGVDNIDIPFDNISIKFIDDAVVIKGDNFMYSFPPVQFEYVWESMKKAIK